MGSFLHRFSRAFPSFSSSALFSLRTSITSISNVSSVHEKTDRNCILSLIIYIEVKLLITYFTKRVKMQRERERKRDLKIQQQHFLFFILIIPSINRMMEV